MLGDSVIWGHYVTGEQTLSHYLNEHNEKAFAANLGVDGIHPMAMYGLVKYYGGDIRKKSVILYVNPLWMSSLQSDMQSKEETRFNHPRLVPQVFSRPRCYRPSLAEIIGIVAETT